MTATDFFNSLALDRCRFFWSGDDPNKLETISFVLVTWLAGGGGRYVVRIAYRPLQSEFDDVKGLGADDGKLD